MTDNVNHPKHYNSHPSGVKAITLVEHMNFNVGNAMKYLWQSEHKNGLEDLKKAFWFGPWGDGLRRFRISRLACY